MLGASQLSSSRAFDPAVVGDRQDPAGDVLSRCERGPRFAIEIVERWCRRPRRDRPFRHRATSRVSARRSTPRVALDPGRHCSGACAGARSRITSNATTAVVASAHTGTIQRQLRHHGRGAASPTWARIAASSVCQSGSLPSGGSSRSFAISARSSCVELGIILHRLPPRMSRSFFTA